MTVAYTTWALLQSHRHRRHVGIPTGIHRIALAWLVRELDLAEKQAVGPFLVSFFFR